jgi:hypothetical protein
MRLKRDRVRLRLAHQPLDLLDIGIALVHGDVNSRAVESLGERQPADARTDDDDVE